MKRLDALGDRLKEYERLETEAKFLPMIPVYARIDGRCFSKFTKGMRRPYDTHMSDMMIATTKYLVEETGALTGYTQSDEISLIWLQEDPKSDILFSGKKQKMVSSLAALATAKFVQLSSGEHTSRLPTFDARVFNIPNKMEGMNCIMWRVQDAVKNSVSMAAQSMFSHKDLQGKKVNEMKDMMMNKGVYWNEYPQFFKEGSFVKRVEYNKYCPNHGVVIRTEVDVITNLGKFSDLTTEERIDFIFSKYSQI